MKGLLNIAEEGGGTHQIVKFKTAVDDAKIIAFGNQCGLTIMCTSAYYVLEAHTGEFMLPFADIDTERIDKVVSLWASMIEESVLA
jgi:DNA-binding transcriptional MocR family regulator